MPPSKRLLIEFFDKVKEKKIIDNELVQKLEELYPDKSPMILEVIKRGVVKNVYKPSNRVVWTVIGENDEYIVYPKLFCSCNDFYNNVVIKRKRNFCKHLLAQLICEALNSYKFVELKDIEFQRRFKALKLNH